MADIGEEKEATTAATNDRPCTEYSQRRLHSFNMKKHFTVAIASET